MNRLRIIYLGVLVLLLALLPGMGAAAEEGINFGDQVGYHRETGMVTFVGTDAGGAVTVRGAQVPGIQPQDQRMAILGVYAPMFGEKDPAANLTETRFMQRGGRVTTRYQQTYQGIPVLAGELILNTTEDGRLMSLSGELSPEIDLSIEPIISSRDAAQKAVTAITKYYGGNEAGYSVSEPELWIYDPRLLEHSDRPASLVWRMEVSGSGDMPVRALVLIDAQRGFISLQFNQIDTAWVGGGSGGGGEAGFFSRPETVNSVAGTATRETYDANNTTDLDNELVCSADDADCITQAGSDMDTLYAHIFAGETYDLYWNLHGRDSIDDAGMVLVSTTHYDVDYYNAFWNGDQMVYGDAATFAQADDVVAHEITHGVTQYTSGLFYYYQSGAINESFSDVWGEFLDLSNEYGSDDLGDRWYVGEDLGIGNPEDVSLRYMADPTASPFYDPDRMTNVNYYTGSGDYGGVHTNSGVNNKAVYLMVDGSGGVPFNGYTITGLGIDKVASIYYDVQLFLLTSGSDYLNLYYAVNQSCQDKIGGEEGITVADCTEVNEALLAVEMNEEPYVGFNPEAEVCPAGTYQNILFEDDFESGTSNWDTTDTIYSDTFGGYYSWLWGYGYSTSGAYDFWGFDFDSAGELMTWLASTVSLPITSSPIYLRFNHSFEFDWYGSTYYDGGILEYSIDGGAWTDANGLIEDGQGYNGAISLWNGTNPRVLEPAFVGPSHGYVSSRYDLSTFNGHTVNFRFVVASDDSAVYNGWDVDDVQIYSCLAEPAVVTGVAASDGTFATKVQVTWSSVMDTELYEVYRDTDPGGGTMALLDTTANTFYDDTTASDLTTYYYWISACNVGGCSSLSTYDSGYADSASSPYIFMDGFESGDFSYWSRVNLGSGFLTVCAPAAMNGSWGTCVDRGTNDKRKVLIDDTPVDQTSFAIRFNMDINSFSMPDGTRFRFLEAKRGLPRTFFLVLRRFNGQYQIQLNILVDGQIKYKSAWYTLSDEPHSIEIDWQASSADGANDGYIQLYLDDGLLEEITGLDNDTHFVSSLRIGFIGRLTGSPISGIWHVDDVATSKNGHIGLP